MPERITPSVLTVAETSVDGKKRMDVGYLQKVLESYLNSQDGGERRITSWKVEEWRRARSEGETAFKLTIHFETKDSEGDETITVTRTEEIREKKSTSGSVIIGSFDQICFQLEMMFGQADR